MTRPDQARLLYVEYKSLGNAISAKLDPNGRLDCVKRHRAKEIVPELIKELPDEQHDTVYQKLTKAIELRKECAEYHQDKSIRSRKFHSMYISFLKYIKSQLSLHINERARPLEQPYALKEVHQYEARSEVDDETHDDEGSTDDEETEDFTPHQIDFLAFLRTLMTLVEKAATLWAEAAHGKLVIWVAANLSGILLREVDNLVEMARLLDEESRKGKGASEVPSIWSTVSENGGRMTKSRLAQDWVDALDKIGEKGAPWHELNKHLSLPWAFDMVLKPGMDAAPSLYRKIKPYVANMLFAGMEALSDNPLPSEIPLVTILGVYFCKLVVNGFAAPKTATQDYQRFLSTARDTACVTIDENLAVLPRMIADKSLSPEDVDEYRSDFAQLKRWAHTCKEPMSLGHISLLAQMRWVYLCTHMSASNSLLLQVFLYLCEKRRLEASKAKGVATEAAMTTMVDEYERLVGAMLEDPRITRVLLQNGRPTTVSQCDQALQQWCGLLSTQRIEVVERSLAARSEEPLSLQILNQDYGLTKDMRRRLSAREGKDDDDDALRRYLTWEASTPNCFRLEEALFKAMRKHPQCQDMRISTTSQNLPRTQWKKKIIDVIDAGLHVLFEKSNQKTFMRKYQISCSLTNAILKVALKMPGHEESLKTAYVETFPDLVALWKGHFAKDSFADDLFEATMPKWQSTLKTLQIQSVYDSLCVETSAYVTCMLGDNETSRGNKRRAKQNKQKGEEGKPRNDLIGDILKDFLEEAIPILEATYGKGQR